MGLGVKEENRWTNGIVPYQFVLPEENNRYYNNAVMLMSIVERCMKKWMESVNTDGIYITFSKKAEPTVAGKLDDLDVKYIELKDTSQTGAGSNGKATGGHYSNVCTLPIGTRSKKLWAAVPHELGHILGMSHENERNGLLVDHPYKDGDIPRLCHNFTREELVRPPNLKPKTHLSVKDNNVDHGDYDPQSIMHYPAFDAFVWNCPPKNKRDVNRNVKATEILKEKGMYLNYPELIDVAPEAVDPPKNRNKKLRDPVPWAPSKGDIAMIQFMYPKKTGQKL